MVRAIVGMAVLLFSVSCAHQETIVTNQAEACPRAVLQTAVDSYLAAQEAGDPSKMFLASRVKYFENMTEVQKEEGLWNTPLPIAFHRSFLDVESCRTFTEVIITGGEHPYVLGTRLKVDGGRISEVDSLVSDEDDFLFNAGNYLKYSTAEDWRILNPDERVDRQSLIAAGDAYFDRFEDPTVEIPLGIPCARLEGGGYTAKDFDDPNASCDIDFPEDDSLPMTGRSYVVDEEMGTVNIFLRFGFPPGAPDSHTFRVVNGKIRYVHTLTLSVPGIPIEQIVGTPPPEDQTLDSAD